LATHFDVKRYIEEEGREKVLSAKPEQTFTDMGPKVTVWNVKTEEGAWWVVEGDGVPMNLYPQGAYYFSSDEAYSFHMGVMARVMMREEHDPEHLLRLVTLGHSRFIGIRRKLHVASEALSKATEPEDFQAIGLACRETLIALGGELVLDSEVPSGTEIPKLSDFKNRARLAVDRLLPGSENSELRAHARKTSEAAWVFSSTLTHSPNRTIHEAFICVSLVGAVLTLFEQLLENDGMQSQDFSCPICRSRQLEYIDRQATDDEPSETILHCNYCGWQELIALGEDQYHDEDPERED
jgi:DNA-directed RNA polymerase subunit M/transcription elongation factor TFIIS